MSPNFEGKISRRQFVGLLGSCAAVSAGAAWAKAGQAGWPDLVGVKDGSPAQMFDAGIKALGGMARFVKKGSTVLVKPNIGWAKTPNEGACTNPELVGRVVETALQAGAKKVFVFDHCVDLEEECHRLSGIGPAVRAAGGEMRTAANQSDYRKVPVQGASLLKEVEVHKLYLDCDVVVNVPVLKSHGGANMTAALKNLMGVVWDRGWWHRNGLHQAIAEFPLVRKPDLNVVDAFIVMVKNGPRGLGTEDLLLKKTLILSPDIVLADTAAVKTLGLDPSKVQHIGMAEKLGIGSSRLDKKSVKRISLAA